jgi:hypothetical protein
VVKEALYLYQPHKEMADTSVVFDISQEGKKLRVKNNHTTALLSNLTREEFQKVYNEFLKYLNLNFAPIQFSGTMYQLIKSEQAGLEQKRIMHWVYFYTINNMKVVVTPEDFAHPQMVDYVLAILDKKYGIDSTLALTLGASILRLDFDEYCKTVKGRRLYYDR